MHPASVAEVAGQDPRRRKEGTVQYCTPAVPRTPAHPSLVQAIMIAACYLKRRGYRSHTCAVPLMLVAVSSALVQGAIESGTACTPSSNNIALKWNPYSSEWGGCACKGI